MSPGEAANLRVVLDALAALSAADYANYLGHMAPDVRFHIGGRPAGQDVIGRAALWNDVLAVSTRSIGDGGFREEILATIAERDWVVVQSRGSETTVAGDRYDNDYLCFFRLRDGEIAEIRYYLNTALTRRIKGL